MVILLTKFKKKMLKETPLLKYIGQKLPYSEETLSVCKQLKKWSLPLFPSPSVYYLVAYQ